MSRRKTNSSEYDLSNLEELKRLSAMLAPAGIHLEVNLFSQPYIILEDQAISKFNNLKTHEANHS